MADAYRPDVLKILLFGMKFPYGISIDVTKNCNLNCKHCYFHQQKHENQLSKEDILNKIKKIKEKNPSIIHASWVGGEPLLRKEVIEEGSSLFDMNMVVTNGTIELPKWKNCTFYISIDGTKKYHDAIRGQGIYDRIKQNARRDDVKIVLACVLNKKNQYCIEDMLKEWTNLNKSILFEFYTPIEGINEDLWLNWEERDRIVKKLIRIKRRYGNYIYNPTPLLKLMLSENSKKLTSNCPVPKAMICLDPLGKRKLPCVIGNKADCSKCGCAVPFLLTCMGTRKQLVRTILDIFKSYITNKMDITGPKS